MAAARVELLAPAKDGPTARAAIQCGADAIYMGAPRFGAREAAGNSISTIRHVTTFAHQYYVRAYIVLNTLLRDDELPAARRMIEQLYEAGIDGLIIQNVGLLELDLPPLLLIASTQMHNATAEPVKFWEDVGFPRVTLTRELTLEQIRDIRRRTRIELECFIHGALCVGGSGQCYMSYAPGGRSGNRGQCAQPCRRSYSLRDRHGEETISPAAESGLDLSGRLIMTTKYCLRRELGLCRGPGGSSLAEPLVLEDENGREYELHFRCGPCGMEVFLGHKGCST